MTDEQKTRIDVDLNKLDRAFAYGRLEDMPKQNLTYIRRFALGDYQVTVFYNGAMVRGYFEFELSAASRSCYDQLPAWGIEVRDVLSLPIVFDDQFKG